MIEVQAQFIIVQGRLSAGSASQQFSQRLFFTLLPNPDGRSGYLFTSSPPADVTNPRDLGHKAFVVVSGWRMEGVWE